MQTLQIPINERIIRRIGLQAIKDRFLKELEYLYFEDVAQSIEKEINISGIDNHDELEKAREKAWNSYKESFLKDIDE